MIKKGPFSNSGGKINLNIPYDFISIFVGLIDGDGYISITKAPRGFIRIQLILSIHSRALLINSLFIFSTKGRSN